MMKESVPRRSWSASRTKGRKDARHAGEDRDEPGEWFSELCRDGHSLANSREERRAVRKYRQAPFRPALPDQGGRPRKFKTNADRQKAYRHRSASSVTKPLAA